ncbi:DUF6236 family protein [Promicromonospora sp. NPDC050249]|uniref:DUF6236 family protein n=1 Tax=Promicromonospora sp. NPDC050249 TaxID=3154743 RepID=UPI0033D74308
MQAHGLYFPYIHIRDDNWLKTAALYWPTVGRLVPRGHQTHDSPTARAFAQAEVLRSENPQALLATAGLDLLQALWANADELATRYRVVPGDGPAHVDHDTGRGLLVTPEHQHLGWVHLDKFPHGAVEMLVDHGLAVRGRKDRLAIHSEHDPTWSELGYNHVAAETWIGLHPAVAGAYMTALVGRFSEHGNFQPITDQDDLRSGVPHRDVTEALQLLMGTASRPQSREGLDRYVALSVQAAAPADLSLVSPDKILECREKLQGELETFRAHVAKQADELAQIASLPVDHRRLETFNEHVEKHIKKPLQDLERGLALLRLPTTRTMLTASSFAAPAGVTAATNLLDQPVIAASLETVAVVGTAWWTGVRLDRKNLRTESEVGYLLGVREQLTPKTLANRARKLWAGTY